MIQRGEPCMGAELFLQDFHLLPTAHWVQTNAAYGNVIPANPKAPLFDTE